MLIGWRCIPDDKQTQSKQKNNRLEYYMANRLSNFTRPIDSSLNEYFAQRYQVR